MCYKRMYSHNLVTQIPVLNPLIVIVQHNLSYAALYERLYCVIIVGDNFMGERTVQSAQGAGFALVTFEVGADTVGFVAKQLNLFLSLAAPVHKLSRTAILWRFLSTEFLKTNTLNLER